MIELFHYEFMQNAFLAGTLAAILSGIVGYFVIARRLSFAAHALGHIGFAGASGALLLGLSPLTGQWLITLIAAFGIGALGERLEKNDQVIGIILAFSLGLGTLFLTLSGGYAGQSMIILFGNLLSVTSQDLKMMAWLALICLLAMTMLSKRLLFASFEPELAQAKGLSVFWLSILFLLIMATAVTIASQVVGVILVFTLIIGPAAISLKWTQRFWSGLLLSVGLAVGIVWLGIILAYFTDWPISFWISALMFGIYLL